MSAHLPWKQAQPSADADEFFNRSTMQECAVIAAYVAALIADHAPEASLLALAPSIRLLRETTTEVRRCFRAFERAGGRL